MNRPERLYTGPAVPATYDPTWQGYTNLTPAQIAAFQAMPQDLIKYAGQRRWQKEIGSTVQGVSYLSQSYITVGGIQVTTNDGDLIRLLGLNEWAKANPNGTTSFTDNGVAVSITAAQAAALFAAVMAFIQACRQAEATLIAGINATPPTVTSRAQVDAAFAAIPTTY